LTETSTDATSTTSPTSPSVIPAVESQYVDFGLTSCKSDCSEERGNCLDPGMCSMAGKISINYTILITQLKIHQFLQAAEPVERAIVILDSSVASVSSQDLFFYNCWNSNQLFFLLKRRGQHLPQSSRTVEWWRLGHPQQHLLAIVFEADRAFVQLHSDRQVGLEISWSDSTRSQSTTDSIPSEAHLSSSVSFHVPFTADTSL
jgi:hypothetical protein